MKNIVSPTNTVTILNIVMFIDDMHNIVMILINVMFIDDMHSLILRHENHVRLWPLGGLVMYLLPKLGQNRMLFVQKNAALGGALTGAFLSVSDARFNQDKIVRTAITASALAAASEFLKLNLN